MYSSLDKLLEFACFKMFLIVKINNNRLLFYIFTQTLQLKSLFVKTAIPIY